MFIKICGLSNPDTLRAAVRGGADAAGFVLAPGYPRSISPEQAAELVALVPAEVETVAVFRDQPLRTILDGATRAGVRTVQLHGSEPREFVHAVESAGFGVLRAFSAEAFTAMGPEEREFWESRRILLDAVSPGEGVPFDPALLEGARPRGHWLLAGGLNAGNVAGLVQRLGPDGVDVSSGVEESRGVKSVELIEEFLRVARALPAHND